MTESLQSAIDRCDREIAELDALPADVNAKAVDIVMAKFDWEYERRLIQRQIEEQA